LEDLALSSWFASKKSVSSIVFFDCVFAKTEEEIVSTDGSGRHQYAIIAVGVQGRRTAASPTTVSLGLARLRWESVEGADAYVVVRDGKEVTEPLRIEGSQKVWADGGGS
jgi:hypothetical protein